MSIVGVRHQTLRFVGLRWHKLVSLSNRPILGILINAIKLKQLPAVLIRANPSIIPERLLQISPTALFDLLPTVQADFKVAFEAEKVVQFEKCRKLIEDNPLMLFIKGTPEAPKYWNSE